MKRNDLVLIFALLLTVAFSSNADAADANADASVVLIAPNTIVKASDLKFGTISTSGGGGTVTISTTADTPTTGASDLVIVGSEGSRAKFVIGGAANQSYTLTVDSAATLTDQGGNGGASMPVSLSPSLTNGSQTLPATGTDELHVGGVLTIGSSQAASEYSGSFNVNVVYD